MNIPFANVTLDFILRMKKQLLIIFLLSAYEGRPQNLVLNGNFETYTSCPSGLNQLSNAQYWINPSPAASPDYYHECSTHPYSAVPNNIIGYQQPLSGLAYGGIIIYWVTVDYREYLEVSLSSPLIAGNCYYFEMYMNLGGNCKYTHGEIGVYFSNTPITGVNNWNPLPYTPQIVNASGNTPDTLNWTLVTGTYTAQGGETYLIIGNFNNDANTGIIMYNNNAPISSTYIYIDDVSLSPCTNIEESHKTVFSIYPNPADEFLVISSESGIKKELKIFDAMGKEVLNQKINKPSSVINIQSLQNGIYFIGINNVRKKLVISD